jgi:Bacterial CdiA-CT RNAse A domain
MWRAKIFLLGFLLAIAGCGSAPQPELAPEIPPRAMPRSDARESANHANDGERTQPTSGRYDLSRDEERGGHTLAKHVGRSDDELRQRLDRERNISAASTWTDRAAAEETVGAALRQEQRKIGAWQSRGDPRANLALHFDAGRVIGRSMRHGSENSSPCTNAVIVLKAAGPESFYVLTTYPEEQR